MVHAEHKQFFIRIANKGLLSLRQSDETISVHNFPHNLSVLNSAVDRVSALNST